MNPLLYGPSIVSASSSSSSSSSTTSLALRPHTAAQCLSPIAWVNKRDFLSTPIAPSPFITLDDDDNNNTFQFSRSKEDYTLATSHDITSGKAGQKKKIEFSSCILFD
jgi:hypothetical protein